MNQLKKAAILSYIHIVVRNILAIFITPFMLKMIGNAEYGLYSLVGALIGYLYLFDFGLNGATIRYIAQYRAQNDRTKEENFLATSLILYAGIALIVSVVGIIFYFNLDKIYSNSFTANELIQAKIMLLILIFNVMISLPGKSFEGIIKGYEHFVIVPLVNLFKVIIRIILLVAILYLGSKAIGMVVLDTIVNIISIIITLYYAFSKLKVKIKLHRIEFSFIKEILGYSFLVFIMALVFQFQWSTGQVLLAINYRTDEIAVFAVGVMLGINFNNFGNVINGMLLPKIVKSIYSGVNGDELTIESIRIARIVTIILLYILLGFLLIGKDFVYLWVGEYYRNAWIIGWIIMLGYIIEISQGYIHAILEAKKMLKFKSIILVITTIVGLPLGVFLSRRYGIVGMALGISGMLILFQFVLNIYFYKVVGLKMVVYFKKAVLPFILPVTIIVLFNIFLFENFSTISWSNFVIKGIIYSISFSIIFFFMLNNQERNTYFSFLRFI